MTFKDVMDFVRANPACFMATMDGDQPRVRGFLTVLFGDDKLYFTTGARKRVYSQLVKNRKIELCYVSQNPFKQLRITGEIEIVDDRDKKQKLLNERDYLKAFGGTADEPAYILLRLSHGKAHFWTLADNTKPQDEIEIIEF